MTEKSHFPCIINSDADDNTAERLLTRFNILQTCDSLSEGELYLYVNADGVFLVKKGADGKPFRHNDGRSMRGDFTKMLPRLTANNLNRELLVKAAKIKGAEGILTASDATAGLGEDSLLLAAAGFQVRLYERDPIIAALLYDTLYRASKHPLLCGIVSRMRLFEEDSVTALPKSETPPDVVFLDPMFPERRKSSLIKKKFQLLQGLERPCSDENELLCAAIDSKPRRIVIKRPSDAPFLGGRKPDYSVEGSTIRYDCHTLAREENNKK